MEEENSVAEDFYEKDSEKDTEEISEEEALPEASGTENYVEENAGISAVISAPARAGFKIPPMETHAFLTASTLPEKKSAYFCEKISALGLAPAAAKFAIGVHLPPRGGSSVSWP